MNFSVAQWLSGEYPGSLLRSQWMRLLFANLLAWVTGMLIVVLVVLFAWLQNS